MLSSSRTRGPRCAALKYHSLKNPLNAVQPLLLHSIFFWGFLTVIEVGRLCPGSVSYEAFNGAIGAKPWLGVGGLPKSSPGCQGRDGIRSLGMPRWASTEIICAEIQGPGAGSVAGPGLSGKGIWRPERHHTKDVTLCFTMLSLGRHFREYPWKYARV